VNLFNENQFTTNNINSNQNSILLWLSLHCEIGSYEYYRIRLLNGQYESRSMWVKSRTYEKPLLCRVSGETLNNILFQLQQHHNNNNDYANDNNNNKLNNIFEFSLLSNNFFSFLDSNSSTENEKLKILLDIKDMKSYQIMKNQQASIYCSLTKATNQTDFQNIQQQQRQLLFNKNKNNNKNIDSFYPLIILIFIVWWIFFIFIYSANNQQNDVLYHSHSRQRSNVMTVTMMNIFNSIGLSSLFAYIVFLIYTFFASMYQIYKSRFKKRFQIKEIADIKFNI
jgi:hypothetical protein